jgi:uncharacterized NAD(P)/FAD-binding protein YdhS
MPVPPRILVVGGGACGALAASALLRRANAPLHVVVAERHGEIGRGLAYSTDDSLHRLNVPASGMSARPDDPDHFVRWSGLPPAAFAPRALYGRYLQDFFAQALTSAQPGVSATLCAHAVVNLRVERTSGARRYRALLDDATTLEVDAVVVAVGNAAPAQLPGLDAALVDSPHVIADPWRPDALDAVPGGARVLAIGTGLTFVDVALSITERDDGTCVDGLSRHGLLPRAHRLDSRPRRALMPPADLRLSTLMRWLHQADDTVLEAVDGLRPVTDRVWRGWSEREQASFLRHGARRWEVLRHRMAPESAVRVASLIRDGRVAVMSGTVAAIQPSGDEVRARLVDGRELRADFVINCTGPADGPAAHPLIRSLLAEGCVIVSPHGLGLAVEPRTGAALDRDGHADPRMVVVGGLRRGALWETTAVPELREQAVCVADHLLEALAGHSWLRRPIAG